MFKVVAFWDMTPCGPSKNNRCFGGTCRLHLGLISTDVLGSAVGILMFVGTVSQKFNIFNFETFFTLSNRIPIFCETIPCSPLKTY
jgi:hypothetical protein